jgi:hypothetical protein
MFSPKFVGRARAIDGYAESKKIPDIGVVGYLVKQLQYSGTSPEASRRQTYSLEQVIFKVAIENSSNAA